ncbi:LTA synthase family protein [Fictibacillus sp. BK138]|uniref:LTA synthase family protein n=1 Tax=Fictibacillus sp. BK138 TaxID=2512121 RepID=UPI001029B08E|nr:LTA synthase family protein [Fictibacillus sp. BK138]RZT21530.1 phosphoglycerol transferase MdoB-like AlkP superfamily enzyme [Fictibacillus sp. BK138]
MKKQFKTLSISLIIYGIFVVLVGWKLTWFSDQSDTLFSQFGIVDMFKHMYEFFINNESFSPLRKGVLLVSFGAVILTSFWTLFLKVRKQIIALLILNFILSFIILADTIYFRYFEDLISSAVLLQIKQMSSLGSSVGDLFSWNDFIIFFDLILLIPLTILFFKKTSNKSNANPALRLATGLLAGAAGAWLFFYPLHDFVQKGGAYLFDKTLSSMRVYEVTGLLGFHGFDTYKYLDEYVLNKKEVSAKDRKDAKAWFDEKNEIPSIKTPYFKKAEGKNLIMVQLEAYQSFIIDKSINGQEITPNLNKLKKESLYFNDIHHQTASGRTSDAEFAANTSLYPLPTGSAYVRYPRNGYDSLPSIFKQNGYDTAAFHAYKPGFWNRYIVYPNLGFNEFHSIEDYKEGEQVGWAIGDEDFFLQSTDKLKSMKEPFYSFMIALTSHYPYTMPAKYQNLKLDDVGDANLRNYLQSVHYVDKAVGTFIDKLKKEGLWENSVVVFYGDHDTGYMQANTKSSIFARKDADALGELEVKDGIPLFIHVPDVEGKEFDKAGGQVDIMPTLLHLFGIEKEYHHMGNNLLDGKKGTVVFRYGSVKTDDLYYKSSYDLNLQNGTCYDLSSRETVSVEKCQPLYETSVEELSISDDVIYGNLIEQWQKTK